eukprot:Selendium_serpulae@DN1130_c0_g1_i2.p1
MSPASRRPSRTHRNGGGRRGSRDDGTRRDPPPPPVPVSGASVPVSRPVPRSLASASLEDAECGSGLPYHHHKKKLKTAVTLDCEERGGRGRGGRGREERG